MKLKQVFASSGLLGRNFKEYEERPQQLKMAKMVRKAIRSGKSAVIEGASGSGKSFSYLIPLILSEEKFIVSTSNKSLQDQLSKKDLPALKKVFPVDFDWTVLKGKNNYFCQGNFEAYLKDIEKLVPKRTVEKIARWARKTRDGDVEHYPSYLLDSVKQLITCDRNTVHAKGSKFYDSCFAVKARAKAKRAQIILTNHTLVALDFALRKRTGDKVSLLPETKILVIDEAHAFERCAMMAFSDKINIFSLSHLFKQNAIKKTIPKEELESTLGLFNTNLRRFEPEKGKVYYRQQRFTKFNGFNKVIIKLKSILKRTEEKIKLQRNEADVKKIEATVKEGRNFIERLEDLSREDKNMLRWSEAKELHGILIVNLMSVPVNISKILGKDLFKKKTVICTSATLAINSNFDFFKYQLGMPEDALELAVGSPFDFKKNCLIYVSDGSAEKYWEIQKLIEFSKGNAFVLFTSYRDMNEMYDSVKTSYPKLIQSNDVSRVKLLKDFKKTPNAVLFGTKSFWEGVDIQENKLALVIIHKVPFDNPADLIYSTKIEGIDKDLGKGKHWMKYTIPSACLKLKQGAGRLIRSKTDTGVIALLDARVNFRSYGKMVVDTLPPAYRTQKMEKVKRFFERVGI